MGKAKSSFRRFIKIVFNCFSIAILLLILNVFFFFCLENLNYQNKLELKIIRHLILNKEKVLKKKVIELEELEERITNLHNINQKVIQIKEQFFNNALEYESLVLKGQGAKRIAYLTVDDGPYSYTSSFLDVFKENDVLATFFLIGQSKESYYDIYQRIYNEGHTIANHTYSHAIFTGLYKDVDSFVTDVIKQESFLLSMLGVKTNVLRFPGGSTTAKLDYRKKILSRLRDLNYGYVDWNVSASDAGGNLTAEEIYNSVINGIKFKRVAIILMHDFNPRTLKALPNIIKKLKEEDFIFLPLFYESSMIIK